MGTGEVLRNQIGIAYVKREWMRDLCVMMSLLGLTTRGASKGPQDVKSGSGTGDQGSYVAGEG